MQPLQYLSVIFFIFVIVISVNNIENSTDVVCQLLKDEFSNFWYLVWWLVNYPIKEFNAIKGVKRYLTNFLLVSCYVLFGYMQSLYSMSKKSCVHFYIVSRYTKTDKTPRIYSSNYMLFMEEKIIPTQFWYTRRDLFTEFPRSLDLSLLSKMGQDFLGIHFISVDFNFL